MPNGRLEKVRAAYDWPASPLNAEVVQMQREKNRLESQMLNSIAYETKPRRYGWRQHFRHFMGCYWPLTPHTCGVNDWPWLERLRRWIRGE